VDVMVVLIGDLIGAETRVSSTTCGGIEVGHGLSSVCTLGFGVNFEVNEWEVAPGPEASVDFECDVSRRPCCIALETCWVGGISDVRCVEQGDLG
jgi:hypothetical protein